MSIIVDGAELYNGYVIEKVKHTWLDGMTSVYAVVYDKDEKKIKKEQIDYYGSDFCSLYKNCKCDVDLTPENAREIIRNLRNEILNAYNDSLKVVKVNDYVEVVRGRKVVKGTKGFVFWKGEKINKYNGNNELICGLKNSINDKSEKPVWIKAEYLLRLEPAMSSQKKRKTYAKEYLEKKYSKILQIANKHD